MVSSFLMDAGVLRAPRRLLGVTPTPDALLTTDGERRDRPAGEWPVRQREDIEVRLRLVVVVLVLVAGDDSRDVRDGELPCSDRGSILFQYLLTIYIFSQTLKTDIPHANFL